MKLIKLFSLVAAGSLSFAMNAFAADQVEGQAAAGAELQLAAQSVDDSTLTTKVKTSLLTDKTTSSADIAVESQNGTVQLTGTAKNEEEKARAVELARQTDGVKDVKDNITVNAQ